jgi:hypothetical protein
LGNSVRMTEKEKRFRGFFVCNTGVWTQGLHPEPLHQSFFMMSFFKTGSCELFAWNGFKPRSSWSLPPE